MKYIKYTSIIIVVILLYNYRCTRNYEFDNLCIREISPEKMLDNIDKNIIFIVRNFINDFSYITPAYLADNYGNQLINAHTTISEQYQRNIISISLNDFFKKYTEQVLYIKEDLDFMYKTKLHKGVDVKMRAYFTNLFLRYYFIWIGSKGSRTGLHKDTDDQNYLLQIYGTKKVILFKSNNDDIFKVREEKEGGATLSSIDYWKEGINTEHQEIILNPGDILSIPPGWWHCAENLTETIAISCRSESLTGLLSKLLYGG